jgi:hypothetical protein
VTVNLMDGNSHALEIDSATSAHELLGLLAAKIGLTDSAFYAIYEVLHSLSDASQRLGELIHYLSLQRNSLSLFLFVFEYYLCFSLVSVATFCLFCSRSIVGREP